jgi:hypothetical protein
MLAPRTSAQRPAGRYLTEIFPSIVEDSVTYSTPYGQMMNIFQPVGDTLSARPVIILGHGGSFITGNGNRDDDPTVDSLCNRFARRGYITVSIDYRTTTSLNMFDSVLATDEVIQAISDGKAAIRYFVKDAATTNTYKVDTNNIFIGGNSAGAVLFMHVGYIDSLGACPPNIVAAMTANGGFEGNSGNSGYTTKSKAIINLAGGLNTTSFIGPGSKPSANAQGTSDNIVPYTCGYPLDGFCPVTLCGLGSLEPVYDAYGVYHMSQLFPGAGHVPWSTDLTDLNTVDSMVTVFLYNLVCTGIASVNEVDINADVSLFPNPANEAVNVHSSQAVSDVAMYDQTGRLVSQASSINRENYEINTSRLDKGMYFVRIHFVDANYAPIVRRVVVE